MHFASFLMTSVINKQPVTCLCSRAAAAEHRVSLLQAFTPGRRSLPPSFSHSAASKGQRTKGIGALLLWDGTAGAMAWKGPGCGSGMVVPLPTPCPSSRARTQTLSCLPQELPIAMETVVTSGTANVIPVTNCFRNGEPNYWNNFQAPEICI